MFASCNRRWHVTLHIISFYLSGLILIVVHGFLGSTTTVTSSFPYPRHSSYPDSFIQCASLCNKGERRMKSFLQTAVDDDTSNNGSDSGSSSTSTAAAAAAATTTTTSSDVDKVSDAEALLACYSYLTRRRRIGSWTQKERRARMREAAAPHFFWEEDLSKIAARLNNNDSNRYSQKNRYGDDAYTLNNADDDSEDEMEEETLNLRPSRSGFVDDIWSGDFTSFPIEPSLTTSRRSNSAKRTWKDPNFRKHWYNRRWAGRVKSNSPESQDEKELEQKVRALPSGFLGSSELADMTEAEIQDAIQSYITTQQKRIQSRRATLHSRKMLLEQQMENVVNSRSTTLEIPKESRDSLFVSEEAMKEKQRARSERAKQAYKNRLANQEPQTKDQQLKTKRFSDISAPCGGYHSSSSTPRDAMIRIQLDVNQGRIPTVEDIRLILKPKRMAKRREILMEILIKYFGQRGKCVPLSDSNDLGFVTMCTIDELGRFVIQNIIQEMELRSNEVSSATTISQQKLPTKSLSKNGRTTSRQATTGNNLSCRDTLSNIEAALDCGDRPSITDVQLILKPPKLAGRKAVLRRILVEHLKLSGRCIPTSTGSVETISEAKVEQIGVFVLRMLKQNI